jgi:hypothetical protein
VGAPVTGTRARVWEMEVRNFAGLTSS